MFRSGHQIGPYTLVSKLGRGAFGVVWLAERRTVITTTTVALKIPLDDEIDLEAIKQEAELWVRASGHPNVLPIIEANIYEDQIVIASEYAPDGSLESRLTQSRSRALSVELAAEITSGILAGLEHLHERQIIHRDLKPANILFQGNTPRLGDFGISRILKSTIQSSVVAGTPAYMAPEAFEGKRSQQTDIWATGVILYQLLTGRLPFSQMDIPSLIAAILSSTPEVLPPTVPQTIKSIVEKALSRDVNRRYCTAMEMRHALNEAVKLAEQGGVTTLKTNYLPQSHQRWTQVRKINDVGEVFALDWSPDASQMAGGCRDGKVRLWNMRSGQITSILEHEKVVRAVSFSPDGKLLASGSVGGKIGLKLWDAATGSLQRVFTPDSWVSLRLKDRNSGFNVYALCFSPDGQILATGNALNGRDVNDIANAVKLWDVYTGNLLALLKGHTGSVQSIAFSPDGRKLITAGGRDNRIIVWSIAAAKPIITIKVPFPSSASGGDIGTFAIALSSDGQTLISGSDDRIVRIWDANSGDLRRELTGHKEQLTSIACSSDGRFIASGSKRGELMLWDMQKVNLIHELKGHIKDSGLNMIRSVTFSPDSKILASAAEDGIILWRADT